MACSMKKCVKEEKNVMKEAWYRREAFSFYLKKKKIDRGVNIVGDSVDWVVEKSWLSYKERVYSSGDRIY